MVGELSLRPQLCVIPPEGRLLRALLATRDPGPSDRGWELLSKAPRSSDAGRPYLVLLGAPDPAVPKDPALGLSA